MSISILSGYGAWKAIQFLMQALQSTLFENLSHSTISKNSEILNQRNYNRINCVNLVCS